MALLSLLSVAVALLAVVATSIIAQPTSLSKALASALPDDVILPRHAAAFHRYTKSYWAEQECEVTPACIVRPRCARRVCLAVNIVRQEYQRQKEQGVDVGDAKLFAIRGGGHSAVHGAASVRGGALLDLQLLNEVTCSADRSSVSVGAGARWGDVSQVLDKLGLAVIGGRNSDVGVGGLASGGGLSFLTPRFGLVCSSILSYEIVLASDSLLTASAADNDDLWRALKGGCNNFGIVTRFTIRTVPVPNIWSGFLYMPSSQSAKVLTAFCLNPPGKRQSLATTTIKNDLATIFATHTAYLDAISSVRPRTVKGLNWTLVLQPLLPSWACKGDPNPLGFSDGDTESLIIVSFTFNWSRTSDDDFIKAITRDAMERIDSAAKANNAAPPFRYLNYCAEWQKPFESYGMENLKFLQGVSTKYDPERLFQNACSGGFKLFENLGDDRGSAEGSQTVCKL